MPHWKKFKHIDRNFFYFLRIQNCSNVKHVRTHTSSGLSFIKGFIAACTNEKYEFYERH